jgi:mxaJ protein
MSARGRSAARAPSCFGRAALLAFFLVTTPTCSRSRPPSVRSVSASEPPQSAVKHAEPRVLPVTRGANELTAVRVSSTPGAAAVDPALLRVCADPNDMPFSNQREEGFENRLASLVAQALGRKVKYTFWPQRRGFLRLTLNAHECDVVMGVPVGTERVLTTRPYYRSSYVFVYGPRAPRVRSLDAPELRSLRIGVPVVGDDGANPPPIIALVARGLVDRLRGYSVYGDYREEGPSAGVIRAVRTGEVDLAIAWGPLAGYYARRGDPALAIRAVSERDAPPGQRFKFELAMAVRKDEAALRDRLDRVLASHAKPIAALLDSYGVPRL